MRRALVPLILAAAAFAPAARAQTIVYDPPGVGRLVQQYEAAVQQLEQLRTQVQQGQTLLNSLNTGSAVNTVAAELSSPALRAFLPDAQALVSAAQGKMTPLGALGASANAIRAANRIYTPPARRGSKACRPCRPTSGRATRARPWTCRRASRRSRRCSPTNRSGCRAWRCRRRRRTGCKGNGTENAPRRTTRMRKPRFGVDCSHETNPSCSHSRRCRFVRAIAVLLRRSCARTDRDPCSLHLRSTSRRGLRQRCTGGCTTKPR